MLTIYIMFEYLIIFFPCTYMFGLQISLQVFNKLSVQAQKHLFGGEGNSQHSLNTDDILMMGREEGGLMMPTSQMWNTEPQIQLTWYKQSKAESQIRNLGWLVGCPSKPILF